VRAPPKAISIVLRAGLSDYERALSDTKDQHYRAAGNSTGCLFMSHDPPSTYMFPPLPPPSSSSNLVQATGSPPTRRYPG